jgi:O-antigen/teichoic acid export membrane protein
MPQRTLRSVKNLGLHSIFQGIGPQVLRSGVFSLLGGAGTFLIVIACTPILFHRLGAPLYGVWALAVSILGITGVLENAIGIAVVKYLAEFRSLNEAQPLYDLVWSAFSLAVVAGLALSLLLYSVAPVVAPWLASTEVTGDLISRVVRIAALGLLPVLVRGVFLAVPMGFQRYDVAAVFSFVQTGALWGGAALATILDLGIDGVTASTVVALWAGALAIMIAAVVMLPSPLVIGSWSWRQLRILLPYSFFSTSTGLGAQLFSSVDRITVGVVLGPTQLAYYSIVVGAATKINQVAGLLWQGLVPATSMLAINLGGRERIVRSLSYATVLSVILMLTTAGVLVAASLEGLRVWLGFDFAYHAIGALQILIVVYAVFSVNAPAYHIANGIGAPWINALLSLLGGALTIALIAALGRRWGLNGAAFANAGYLIVLLTIPLTLQRVLAIGTREGERSSDEGVAIHQASADRAPPRRV